MAMSSLITPAVTPYIFIISSSPSYFLSLLQVSYSERWPPLNICPVTVEKLGLAEDLGKVIWAQAGAQ